MNTANGKKGREEKRSVCPHGTGKGPCGISKPRYSAVTYTTYSLLLLATIAPAFLAVSCSRDSFPEEDKGKEDTVFTLELDTVTKAADSCADVFVFDDDVYGRLDTYCHCVAESVLRISARTGPKRIVVVQDRRKDSGDWMHIDSYSSLEHTMYTLESESPEDAVTSGECFARVATGSRCTVSLVPLLSKVTLRRIRCDFSGNPYSGKEISGINVFLMNAGSRCSILDFNGIQTSAVMNCGGICETDVNSMLHPEMLVQRIGGKVGRTWREVGMDFYCYANENPSESLGQPFTKLVVQAVIDGVTYYYPISINRPPHGWSGGVQGISRGESYIIDLTIRSLGALDPEDVIFPSDIGIEMQVCPWTERNDLKEIF